MHSSSRVHWRVIGNRQDCCVYRVLHDKTDVLVVSSNQCSQKCGGVTVEEGTYVVDALTVGFYLNDREELEGKLRGYLVHGKCHLFVVKDSNFGASLLKKLATSNDAR